MSKTFLLIVIVSLYFELALGVILGFIWFNGTIYSNIDHKLYTIDLPEEYPEITTNDTLIAHKSHDTIYFEFAVSKRNNLKH